MSQIDKLAYDIEGYINDFESGVTDKEEAIKALCYYVVERVKTAVESKEKEIMTDVKQRYDWIVRVADGYREMIEEFPDHEGTELWLYRMNGLKQAAKQFQNLFIKE